jgi:diacylglycerol kinase (ATP)
MPTPYHTIIVYNPASGRRRHPRLIRKLEALLAIDGQDLVSVNLQRDSLDAYLQDHVCDRIVVVGGDGTVRAVIDHLARHRLDIPIAIIPRGSANVVAKSIGLPHSLRANAAIIHSGRTVRLDIARLHTGQHFIAAFAMGYLSDRVTHTASWLKQRFGFLGYVIAFLQQRTLPIHEFIFTVDGVTQKVQGHTLSVFNAANLFYFHAKRMIKFEDGLFELMVTTNTRFWMLIPLIWEFYIHVREPYHFVLVRGSRFSIRIPDGISLQLDGERLQVKDQLDITVLPHAQTCIIP